MGESWTVNSDHTETAFIAYVKQLRKDHKYLTFDKPRIGEDRSLSMNALFHVWLTQVIAEKLKISTKAVTPGQLDGTKHTFKKMYYQHTGYKWLITKKQCVITGNEKADFSSSSRWKWQEMYEFLNWMQMRAAENGIILESLGKYSKLQRKHNLQEDS